MMDGKPLLESLLGWLEADLYTLPAAGALPHNFQSQFRFFSALLAGK